MKYLNEDGLRYLVQKIKTWLNGKVDVESGKGLSTNDYTTTEKNKLASLENYTLPTASTEVKGGIKVGAGLVMNGEVLSATGGGTADSVDWSNVQNRPTNLTDFTNDLSYQTAYNATTNKIATASDLPTKVSDLTNDGDGTQGSRFATEGYVDVNGGKIDKIKVNSVEQTITNKTVDITVPTQVSDLSDGANVVKDANYVHTDVNFTSAKDSKLTGIAAGAEVNVISTVKVNGTAQTVTDKAVDIAVPTNNNQLTNGAGYITGINSSDVTTALGFTPYNSTNPSGYQTASDVESAINTKISSTYKAKGSIAFASLPALSSTNEGNVYNITDSFTTTADFVEGAGKVHPAGTNVVIINTTGTTYKYDVLAGMTDLSSYVQFTDLVAITNAEIDTICQ